MTTYILGKFSGFTYHTNTIENLETRFHLSKKKYLWHSSTLICIILPSVSNGVIVAEESKTVSTPSMCYRTQSCFWACVMEHGTLAIQNILVLEANRVISKNLPYVFCSRKNRKVIHTTFSFDTTILRRVPWSWHKLNLEKLKFSHVYFVLHCT